MPRVLVLASALGLVTLACVGAPPPAPDDSGAHVSSGTSEAAQTETTSAAPMTSSGSGSGPATSPDGGSTRDDGPPPEDPYGECSDDEDCPWAASTCIDLGTDEVCAPPCDDPESCPVAEGSSFEAVCTMGSPTQPLLCVLPCATDSDCPPGMQCMIEDGVEEVGLPICAWD